MIIIIIIIILTVGSCWFIVIIRNHPIPPFPAWIFFAVNFINFGSCVRRRRQGLAVDRVDLPGLMSDQVLRDDRDTQRQDDMAGMCERTGTKMEVSINGGTPIAGWFLLGKILVKWMMTGGTPILGNHHMLEYLDRSICWSSSVWACGHGQNIADKCWRHACFEQIADTWNSLHKGKDGKDSLKGVMKTKVLSCAKLHENRERECSCWVTLSPCRF